MLMAESTPLDALASAVTEMDRVADKLRKHVTEARAADRTKNQELEKALTQVEVLAESLEQFAFLCQEVVVKNSPLDHEEITSTDEREAAERQWEFEHPIPPQTLAEHCEQHGLNYDSDQSRGIN